MAKYTKEDYEREMAAYKPKPGGTPAAVVPSKPPRTFTLVDLRSTRGDFKVGCFEGDIVPNTLLRVLSTEGGVVEFEVIDFGKEI